MYIYEYTQNSEYLSAVQSMGSGINWDPWDIQKRENTVLSSAVYWMNISECTLERIFIIKWQVQIIILRYFLGSFKTGSGIFLPIGKGKYADQGHLHLNYLNELQYIITVKIWIILTLPSSLCVGDTTQDPRYYRKISYHYTVSQLCVHMCAEIRGGHWVSYSITPCLIPPKHSYTHTLINHWGNRCVHAPTQALYECWGFTHRSSSLHDKSSYPLSHLLGSTVL